jgi:hypothetical protein
MFEEKIIKQVKGGILGIKQGTKTPKEVFERLCILKKYNPVMFEDLLKEYVAVTKIKTSNI